MKVRTAASFALAFLIGLAAPAGAGSTTTAGHADAGRDTIVRSAFVPSDDRPQGEVRLNRRDGAAVMQTVLYTGYLKRVVAEIRKKELASWPPEREGHEDARKYIAAVLEARDRIQERFAARANRGDRRQKMLIEFIFSGKESLVTISEPELEEVNGHMRILSKRPIAALELSRTYVRGDIYEIARDALKLGRKESKALLEPLLPREAGGAAPPSQAGEREGAGG